MNSAVLAQAKRKSLGANDSAAIVTKMLRLTLLVATLSLLLAASANASVSVNPINSDRQARLGPFIGGGNDNQVSPAIIGGEQAPLGKYPYAVRLEVRASGGYQMFCSGALIAQRYVLTAAHCLALSPLELDQTLPQTKMRVRFANAPGTPVAYVKRTAFWRDFNPYLVGMRQQSDVAVLELKTDAPVAPGELSAVDSEISAAPVTDLGYGPTQPNEVDVDSPVLIEGGMQLTDAAVCAGKIQGQTMRVFTATELCAKTAVPSLNAGACHGDSGGPLVANNGKIIGVVSWSKVENCSVTASKRQTVFAAVSPVAAWLQRQTGAPLFSEPAQAQNLAVPQGAKIYTRKVTRTAATIIVDATGQEWGNQTVIEITAVTRKNKKISYSGVAELDHQNNGVIASYPASWRKQKLRSISVAAYARFYNQLSNGRTVLMRTKTIKVKR